jgi:hypothetical protein
MAAVLARTNAVKIVLIFGVLSVFKLNHLKYFCGSGFPAAICTVGVKTIRGWKAAPTI